MAETIKAIIQLRRATEDEWNKIGSSFIPKEGEPCLTLDGENASKVKYGDGVNTWSNLLYANINSSEADWNQNNSNGPGYIKNRTHYSYMVMEEKYNGFEYTEADANSDKQIDVPPDFPPFQVGDTVKVIINDVEYSCVAQNAFDLGVPPGDLPPGSSYVVIADHPLTSVGDTSEWNFQHIISRDNACYFLSDSPAVISWSTGNINYTQDDLAGPIMLPDFPPFQAGDTVKVTINDVEHTCIAQNMFDLGLPSDNYPPGSQMNIITENPVTSIDELSGWYIQYSDVIIGDQCTFYSKTAAVVSYPTGEYEEKEIVEKLPSKYLDPPDWEQNDENGPGYIKNRPFYDYVIRDFVICNYTHAPTSGQSSVTLVNPMIGDLVPGEIYTIQSSRGIEEAECKIKQDGDGVSWAEIGEYYLSVGDSFLWQKGIIEKNGSSILSAFTKWSSDAPLKITGPLRIIKKINQSVLPVDGLVYSVCGKSGDVKLSNEDIEGSVRFNTTVAHCATGELVAISYRPYIIRNEVAYGLPTFIGPEYGLRYSDTHDAFTFSKVGNSSHPQDAVKELVGIAKPTRSISAANKQYVDEEIAKILPPIDGVPDGYVLGISEGKIAWVPKN